jgi:hypothetical protein
VLSNSETHRGSPETRLVECRRHDGTVLQAIVRLLEFRPRINRTALLDYGSYDWDIQERAASLDDAGKYAGAI